MMPTSLDAVSKAFLAVLCVCGPMTYGACSSDDATSGLAIDPDASTAPQLDGAVSAANNDGAANTDSGAGPDASDAGASTPSPGCASSYPSGAANMGGTLSFGGLQRGFQVHVPPSYQKGKPMPVVVMLHGGGGSGLQLELESSRMDPIADREGFITVYPNGTGLIRTWNGGNCCGKAVADNVDDVGFVGALLDHVESLLCTDRRRVFASGMSNGAIMSHRLACELSQRIAAIAPVAGTIGVANCQPTRPVPVLAIHGTSDGHVPWDGGLGCGPSNVASTSVASTVEGWRQRNHCDTTTSAYLDQGDGHCTTFGNCQGAVVLCGVDGRGHSWPGGEPKEAGVNCPADGPQSTNFIASEAIWTFFKNHPMP